MLVAVNIAVQWERGPDAGNQECIDSASLEMLTELWPVIGGDFLRLASDLGPTTW